MLPFGKRTTANIYSHLDFSSRVESAETISNILGDAESGIGGTHTEPKKNARGRKILIIQVIMHSLDSNNQSLVELC